MTKLRNELSTASGVTKITKNGKDELSFTSNDGLHVRLYLDTLSAEEKGICITETYSLTDSNASTAPRLLVSGAASNKNLYVTYGNCGVDGGVVTFENLSVKAKDGDKTLAKIDIDYKIRVLADSAS